MKDDDIALSLNSPYLQGVLYNTRRIVRSVDDSVAKIIDGKPQLIRRSRGYVPYPVTINQEEIPSKSCIPCNEQINCTPQDLDQDNGLKDETILEQENMIFAAGGDLKAAFCLYQAGNAVVSQYFGDLEEVTVMEEYRKSYDDLTRLLKIKPTLAVCDLHPNYHSARFAKELGIPVLQVQHHHAHIAAVMAEHDLRERVIGIAFDGTGYGTDGTIWGGEFLVCEGMEYVRAAHLSYTPIIGGDQSMKDARKTAACYLLNSGLEDYVQDERKEIIKSALKHKLNTVLTSSMGRLFDAVAAILDIGQENRYEGECAAGLEKEAILAIRNNRLPIKLTFAISEKDEIIEMNPEPLLNDLCKLRKEEEIGSLALGFHYAVAEAISEICERLRKRYSCNQVVLSGGVFQNNILTERSLALLRENGFEVYVNMAVPPNDGAISLGQTYLGLCSLNKGY
jgi:hydrogenase maturation protein HypF